MSAFAERRAALLEKLGGAVAVLPSAPVAIRNNDVEHEYRQDSDFYYLSGWLEPETVLVLAPAHPEHHFVLFVRPRDADRERWDGPRAGVEGARERFGADAAYPISELPARLPEYLSGHERLLYRFGVAGRALDEMVFAAVATARSRSRRATVWPTTYLDPAPSLHEMRLFKAESELAALRRACAITRDAHVAAMGATRPGRFEYEIDAELRQTFGQAGSERTAYPPIVASGPHATVLHHRTGTRRLEDGDLLLVDAGCEYGYYASDVTRTWPVSGVFSPAQRQVYEVVLRAQRAAIEAVRPGVTLDEVHAVAVRSLVEGLVSLGVLSGDPTALIAEKLYRPYYMHQTSHWLGMDVHDVGLYAPSGRPRELAPGIVLTIEPGLYLDAGDSTIPERFRGIGVRIEDDILVTAEGRANLTEDIPKTIDEIEAAVRAR